MPLREKLGPSDVVVFLLYQAASLAQHTVGAPLEKADRPKSLSFVTSRNLHALSRACASPEISDQTVIEGSLDQSLSAKEQDLPGPLALPVAASEVFLQRSENFDGQVASAQSEEGLPFGRPRL